MTIETIIARIEATLTERQGAIERRDTFGQTNSYKNPDKNANGRA